MLLKEGALLKDAVNALCLSLNDRCSLGHSVGISIVLVHPTGEFICTS
jgi:hypothetical protein